METWKIKNDPYMNQIYDEFGETGIIDAGYFEDNTKSVDDIDYMLSIPCTPISNAQDNLKHAKNPVVIICTGSFCPPHEGHIDMMQAAKDKLESNGFDVIAGYLSPGHDEYISHKNGQESIPIHKRIALCEKMCNNNWLSVCPWEGIFNKHAIMFTHVVERLKQYLKYHLGKDIPVYFVTGMDNEKYTLAFRKKGNCIVVDRPGYFSKTWPNNAELFDKIQSEKRLFYAECHNPMSSTEVRKNKKITIEKVNLHLRVEDTMFRENGFGLNPLLSIILQEFTQTKISKLSDQIKEFENIKKVGTVLSLDAFLPGDLNIRMSRYYDMFGSKMLRFASAPEADYTLLSQIDNIKKQNSEEFYIFDDDIHTTGGTIRYVSGLFAKLNINYKGALTFKVSDDSEGEILDLRDFLIHKDNCGLVILMPDDSGVRAPYIYPYVCPYARASITNPLEFSIKVWEYNRDQHKRLGTIAKDLGSMCELFAYAGMCESDYQLVHEICTNHIELLKKLK